MATQRCLAKNVIRQHRSKLTLKLTESSDLLLSVSAGLYHCNIIDLATKTEVNKKGGLVGASILLTRVQMKVEESPDDYLANLMDVLRDEVVLRDTVCKMEDYLAGKPSETNQSI